MYHNGIYLDIFYYYYFVKKYPLSRISFKFSRVLGYLTSRLILSYCIYHYGLKLINI